MNDKFWAVSPSVKASRRVGGKADGSPIPIILAGLTAENTRLKSMSFHALDLDDLRNQEAGRTAKTPFEHQRSAFEALNKCFEFGAENGKGGLLVLPTGAGKTFTTVKWLCDNVLTRNIRVLWLANSYYLLDQAFGEILGYARWIPPSRQSLNVRACIQQPVSQFSGFSPDQRRRGRHDHAHSNHKFELFCGRPCREEGDNQFPKMD